MRQLVSGITVLFLCAALAVSPVFLLDLAELAKRPTEAELPAEVEELTDPKIDERTEDKTHNVAGLNRPAPYRAALLLRLSLVQASRSDDPLGSRSNGLRAPPA